MTWQPIETAPRPDVLVLLWDGEDVGVGFRWYFAYAQKEPFNKEWELLTNDLYGGPGTMVPTHWMPLPEPPEEK